MSALKNVLKQALLVLLEHQGTPVLNTRTALSFIAVVNPVYEQDVYAGARIKKRTYNLICPAESDVREGDALTIDGRSFFVLPRERQHGPIGLDEVSKKIRIVEK